MMDILISIMRNPVVLFLTVIFGGAVGHCQSIQFWPEVDLSLTAKRTVLLVPLLARLQSGQRNPQFAALGAIGTVNINQRWSVSAGYLFADLPQQNETAHVPLVALTRVWTARHWTFPDTNRFERLLGFSNQPYRYRNRATADYAFGRHGARHFYVSNELFVNLSNGTWNQNRAMVGVGIPIRRFTRLDTYFLQRSAPRGKETSAIGTLLTVHIGKGS